ncbi:MAG: ATP-dependent DNA helicase [Herbaspirillum sp.]
MSYTVAVRSLCEFTARVGDLDLRFTSAPSASEGMAGHKVVQSRRGNNYETEIRLGGRYHDLQVHGRADGFDSVSHQLEEIKTYRGHLDDTHTHYRAVHWAQAKVYGHLLCQAREFTQLKIALVYFNVRTKAETILIETHEAEYLKEFFEELCARFLSWAQSEAVHRHSRDMAMDLMPFPMEGFRAGQRDLAVAVYRSARSATGGRCLMVQAPTGIGKTIGTVFPMLKASAAEGLDKLFFLTAKGTGHGLALQALTTINRQLAGKPDSFQLRVLDVSARDKVCEFPGKACHGESCPLAKGFYDRLPLARATAMQVDQPWDADTVRAVALGHQICPYYLAQELVRWSDVIVADYNYYYDRSAMLYGLTQANQWKVGVLVDEAHNLVERARLMYSAELSQRCLNAARQMAAGAVKKSLDKLHRIWNTSNQAQSTNYQAYPEVPAALQLAVQRIVGTIAEAFVDDPMLPGDPILTFYLEALQFMALADQMGDHSLFDVSLEGRLTERSKVPFSTLCIRNVVPAPHLTGRHAAAHVTVLFSGTLSPSDFYSDLLGLPQNTTCKNVDGPFNSEQLAVQVAGNISTRYRDRERSLLPITDVVVRQYQAQPGNYLCFFSSFEYLDRVVECLQRVQPDLPTWIQTRNMDESSRQLFLDHFTEQGQGVGFAVLGGAFSEAVDLPGRRLIGAFVATLGLPPVNAINERMKLAMDKIFGTDKGYDYTYLYPGMRKVVQAAGRVIRTESDRGTIFLIDDRYRRASVRALLPSWWQVRG